MIDSIFVVLCLKGFQCLLAVSILFVLYVGMMSGFLPEMSEIVVKRRLQFIPNVCLALYKIDRRKYNADNIFRPFSC